MILRDRISLYRFVFAIFDFLTHFNFLLQENVRIVHIKFIKKNHSIFYPDNFSQMQQELYIPVLFQWISWIYI